MEDLIARATPFIGKNMKIEKTNIHNQEKEFVDYKFFKIDEGVKFGKEFITKTPTAPPLNIADLKGRNPQAILQPVLGGKPINKELKEVVDYFEKER